MRVDWIVRALDAEQDPRCGTTGTLPVVVAQCRSDCYLCHDKDSDRRNIANPFTTQAAIRVGLRLSRLRPTHCVDSVLAAQTSAKCNRCRQVREPLKGGRPGLRSRFADCFVVAFSTYSKISYMQQHHCYFRMNSFFIII